PRRFTGLDRDLADDRSAPFRLDAERAQEETVVERSREMNDDRVARARCRRRDRPLLWRNRRQDGRSGEKIPAKRMLKGVPARVRPRGIDHDSVDASGVERPSELFVRQDAALHASGIEEDREAGMPGIPEVSVERKERVRYLEALIVHEMHERRARLA